MFVFRDYPEAIVTSWLLATAMIFPGSIRAVDLALGVQHRRKFPPRTPMSTDIPALAEETAESLADAA